MAKHKRNAAVAQADTPAAKPPAKPKAPMDPRFAALQTDPRFERFPAPGKSVTIDERFAGMFKDPDFGSHQSVDKRGRKVKRTKHKEDMRRYYRLQGEAERDAAPAAVQQPKKQRSKHKTGEPAPDVEAATIAAASSSQEEESEDDEATAAEKRWALLRGVGQPSESSSSSGGSGGSSEEGQEAEVSSDGAEMREAQAQWGVGALAANPAERIPDGTESRRLAVVDLDWDHVRAVDIHAALRSFLPASGRIASVTVYPSDYGLQRMQEEAAHGPQGIYNPLENGHSNLGRQGGSRRHSKRDSDQANGEDQTNSEDAASDGSDHESDSQAYEEESESQQASDSHSTGDDSAEVFDAEEASDTSDDNADVKDEVDQARLRLYERSKLRYYYAIVEFDSVKTATRVYTECDGLEFQLSSCKFDLRFVPDEQSFEGREVRDVATSVPEDYVAPAAFATLALQHTNVKLTWDKDDDARKRTLAKRVTKDELRDDDFKAYLASESEDSEPDEAAQAKYRALLAGDGADSRKGGKGWGAAAAHESEASEDDGEGHVGPRSDRDMEMELTFGGGLEELGQRLLSRKQERDVRKNDTVWEAYERRRREKRAAAKAQGRRQGSDSEEVSEPDVSDDEAAGRGNGDAFFQHDDDPFNDPFFQDDGAPQPAAVPKAEGAKLDKASSKAARKAEKAAQKAASAAEQQAEARRLAELQLLLMDEGQLRQSAGTAAAAEQGEAKPVAKLSRKDRARLAKARKRRDREVGSDDEDLGLATSHQVDLADPRFAQLYTADDFALDPTDPRFKASESVAAIQQRRAEARSLRQASAQPRRAKQPSAADAGSGAAGEKMPLQAMVASLKRKVGSRAVDGGADKSKPEAVKLKKRKVKAVA